MSEKEYKEKLNAMFAKNTILINEKQILEYNYNELLERDNKIKKQFDELLHKLIDKGIISSWNYNGEYSYTFENSKLEELEKQLEEEKKDNAYFKARFVKCSTCTPENKDKCIMYPDRCEGERCTEYIDLENLLDKAAEGGIVR